MALLLFFMLPALASCRISLTFKDFNAGYLGPIKMEGQYKHVITNKETMTFLLDDHVLRSAAEQYSANRPQSVFLHSPTMDGGDLYKTRNLPQVEVTVKPVSYDVLHFDWQIEDLNTIIVDFSDETKHNLVATVTDSVEAKWYPAGPIEGEYQVFYAFKPFSNVLTADRLTYEFETPWEQNFKNSRELEISHDIQLYLKKEEAERVMLRATKIMLDVVIEYELTLEGMAVCNYYPQKFNFGESYLNYPITPMLEAGKHPTSMMTSQIISAVIYMDPLMLVMDAQTNKTKMIYGANVRVKT